MSKKALIFICITLILIILMTIWSPQKINWDETYDVESNQPYGLSVLNEFLSQNFGKQNCQINTEPIIPLLDTLSNKTNLIFIDKTLQLDSIEIKKLIQYIKKGNSVLISSSYINESLTQNLAVDNAYTLNIDDIKKIYLNVNPNKAYSFKQNYPSYFEIVDSLKPYKYDVLGYLNDSDKPNFIRFNIGKGELLLNKTPIAFSNYYMLNDTVHLYSNSVLQYLPKQKTIIDNYKKEHFSRNKWFLSVILENKHLRSAYYLFLLGLILMAVFGSKRKQNAIPIVIPVENLTRNFLKTISDLFYNKASNIEMIKKRNEFLFQNLARNNISNNNSFDNELAQNIAKKTGENISRIQSIFNELNQIQQHQNVSSKQFVNYNQQLDKLIKICQI